MTGERAPQFNRDDRVRLRVDVSGVTAGTIGTVLGFKHDARAYVVQFPSHGTHEVPEDSVEPS